MARGIFAIETATWFSDEDATDATSVRPVLQCLQSSYLRVPFIYCNAQTKKEFRHHLNRWTDLSRPEYPTRPEYPILYLGYHGERNRIDLEEGTVTIPDLQKWLDGKCQNRIIHFASCLTVKVPEDAIKSFLRETKLSAVSGYERSVDWMESVAYDLLYLSIMQDKEKGKYEHEVLTTASMKRRRRALRRRAHRDLRRHLRFKMIVNEG